MHHNITGKYFKKVLQNILTTSKIIFQLLINHESCIQIIQVRIILTPTFILGSLTSLGLNAQRPLEIPTYCGPTPRNPCNHTEPITDRQHTKTCPEIFRPKHIQYAKITYPCGTENYVIYSNLTNTPVKRFSNSLSQMKT